jgi:hypothetical protein
LNALDDEITVAMDMHHWPLRPTTPHNRKQTTQSPYLPEVNEWGDFSPIDGEKETMITRLGCIT